VVNTVVFLWISAASAASAPSLANGEALSTLGDFGRARGLTFVPLARGDARADRPLGLPANDAAFVDGIEAELEQARTALSALEEASASARLTRVNGQLLAHPHLPQAAFLMGECLALQAQAARDLNPALADALEARRAAIEGPRAPAFGAPHSPARSAAPSELAVSGLGATDELEIDAASIGASRRVSLLPGLHHARVWRRGLPIYATFVEVAPEQRTLELSPPHFAACSREDLADVATDSVTRDVACARWAKVREEPSGIGVALCEHERCGAFVHWQRRATPPFAPIAIDRSRGLPTWATFTIAGATALVATGLVLWQTGAFDRGRASAASWEFEGWDRQALRF